MSVLFSDTRAPRNRSFAVSLEIYKACTTTVLQFRLRLGDGANVDTSCHANRVQSPRSPRKSFQGGNAAMPLVPIILSGGAGTRLWPLSREAAPKPFMPLPDGETLLAKTARRSLALPGVAQRLTLTNRDYYFHTKDTYATLGEPGVRDVFLLEPFGRNTAPA